MNIRIALSAILIALGASSALAQGNSDAASQGEAQQDRFQQQSQGWRR